MLDRSKRLLSSLTLFTVFGAFIKLGLLLYLLAFTYLFYSKGLKVVVWHTHIMFLVYLWVLGYYFIRMLLRQRKPEVYKNVLYIFSLVLAALVVFEVSILLFGKNTRDRNHYWAPYNSRGASYYHSWTPGIDHVLSNTEFAFERKTNSLGFPDTEWDVLKEENELRILCLGDSFTEGDGADQDSTYVSFLHRALSQHFEHLTIMNAGVCGSDPFYNFINLNDLLYQYKPDLVIQTLSMNDITTDYFVRGGMERFIDKGPPEKVKFRKGPWWEPIYAMSYASRIFFRLAGYNYQLLNDEQTAKLLSTADSAHIDLFRSYHQLARNHNFQVCLVLLPLKEHIDFGGQKTENYDFSAIRRFVQDSTLFEVVDLLPEYNRYVAENMLGKHDVYWVYDGHHNARGYQMMAEQIERVVLPLLKGN